MADSLDPAQRKLKSEDERLPVTVLSGFLGSGKTTLLKRTLQNKRGLRVALIVNDMASVNVDADEIKQSVHEGKNDGKLVALQNGCICCTLREDLVEQVSEIAAEKKFDYLLIESSGISEPAPVAMTFCHSLEELQQMAEDKGEISASRPGDPSTPADARKIALAAINLQKVARLDTMVTIVDASLLCKVLSDKEGLGEHPLTKDEITPANDPQRPITALLADQIEFADVIVLNKADLLPEAADRKMIEGVITSLNPIARRIWTSYGEIPEGKLPPRLTENLLGTGLFDMDRAQQSAGWMRELMQEHRPESEEYGIRSMVFRSKRPFHPQRLYSLFSGMGDIVAELVSAGSKAFDEKCPMRNVIRSKGRVWIANLSAFEFVWHSTGANFGLVPRGPWASAVFEAKRKAMIIHSGKTFKPLEHPWGDRDIEIVLIGPHLDKERLHDALTAALISEEEFRQATEEKHRATEDPNQDAYALFRSMPDAFGLGESLKEYMELELEFECQH